MKKQRLYPIGMQSFEDIRKGGFLYVDKTDLVYSLANHGKYYFLSRPRRFGKSLLLSTFDAYFRGRRELFEGLAIADMEKAWTVYPVLRFDFSTGKFETREQLEASIDFKLTMMEQDHGVEKPSPHTNIRMTNLVTQIYRKTGRPVVILVDEYDAAMMHNIDHQEAQDGVRMSMRNLFSPLKELDSMLRFVFITGITKFSQMSIFSELNNLNNISIVPTYETVCGITEEELTTTLRPDIEQLAQVLGQDYDKTLGDLKQMYDGYHFSERMIDMYNPFSLLSALSNQKVASYWFGTGTPTFLIQVLRKFNMELPEIDGITLSASQFDVPVEQAEDPVPVLYQSGYLTIKDYDREFEEYTLGLPNREVKRGLADSLYSHYTRNYLRGSNDLRSVYRQFLRNDDIGSLLDALKTFFAGYPYELNNQNERHYHAILYTLLLAFGADVEAQTQSARGRADLVLKTKRSIYVIELKHNHPAEEAINQIHDKGYALPYRQDSRRVVCVGISFSSQERGISEWMVEEDKQENGSHEYDK